MGESNIFHSTPRWVLVQELGCQMGQVVKQEMGDKMSLSIASLSPTERMQAMLRGINAAATALLHSPRSEEEVFHIFSQQLISLGIEGTFFKYDSAQETLCVQSSTIPPKINLRWQEISSQLGLNPLQQVFIPSQLPHLAKVITTQKAHLFPEVMVADKWLFSAALAPDEDPSGAKRTVIVAPFVYENMVLGLISVSGAFWTKEDIPLIETLANQITFALVNNHLLQSHQQSEQKYRHLFEEAPVMYMTTENRDGEPYIVECNEFTTELLGYTREELIGQPLSKFYTNQAKQQLNNGGYQRALSGTFVHEERQLLTRDGQVLDTILQALPEHDRQGKVMGTRAMYMDISERKQAETQLQQYQEQLKKSLEELNVLVPASAIVAHATENETIVHDIAEYMAAAFETDGCILHVPHDSLNLFVPRTHVRRIQAMGLITAENSTSLILPSTLTDNLATERKLVHISHKQPILTAEEKAILARHEAKTVLLVPLVSRDMIVALAELYSYRGRDYTQRNLLFVQTLADYMAIGLENAHLFEALRHAKEELEIRVQERTAELQARNHELDAFSHTVAHDLQGLLARVIMYAESLLKDYRHISLEEQKIYLRTILQNGRKMKEVIESLFLLATVSMADVKIKPLDMHTIVQDVINRLKEDFQEKQATLQQPEAPEWPIVRGYSPWVEAVWVNYITNALRYGGEPPHITLGFEPHDDNQIRFWVQDEGEGINLEDQARLFEPLTQLHGQEKGHGLGLSIVKRIVSRLGGQVGVESEKNGGSRFYFTLPLVSAG